VSFGDSSEKITSPGRRVKPAATAPGRILDSPVSLTFVRVSLGVLCDLNAAAEARGLGLEEYVVWVLTRAARRCRTPNPGGSAPRSPHRGTGKGKPRGETRAP
jgi:hypothetical protein